MLYAIVLSLMILATALQLLLWRFVYGRLQPTSAATSETQSGVSVVICARNDAANLQTNLPAVLAQEYPLFEVLVVNDHSADETTPVLEDFQKRYPQLRILHLKEKGGKKQALQAGVDAAQHPYLLLTDADCTPASAQWIQEMMAARSGNTQIVLGYAPYFKASGWLNRFVRFETVMTGLQYLSLAQTGIPYMGVGRNLLIERALHLQYRAQLRNDLLSGDDDLMINAAATAANTRICLSPTTFCWSKPAPSWSAFWQQKIRHLSIGQHYRPAHQLLVAAIAFSQFGVYMGLFLGAMYPALLGLFLLRLIVAWMIFWRKSGLLAGGELCCWFPVLDLLQVLYYVVFSPFIFFLRPKKWGSVR
ncbi:MAG: glycosyltransferase [Phaeodactylibacter sp.]|nr:glycosyltransferase [Phaeodactylibacter sp.]